MGTIDKQRIAAVEILASQGYRFENGAWTRTRPVLPDFDVDGLMADADAMHALLILRADALSGHTENSDEAAELQRVADTLERYEAKRWPSGRADGGKG
jgi:hypothetical protein